MSGVDWSAWAKRLEYALGPEGDFPSFFAPGALFSDPVNEPTADLAAIEAMTQASFPDWRQEIIWVHGDDHGGAFEWIGRGTLGGVVHGLLYQPATNNYISDTGVIYTQSALQSLIGAGDTLSVMGVYPGTGSASTK